MCKQILKKNIQLSKDLKNDRLKPNIDIYLRMF